MAGFAIVIAHSARTQSKKRNNEVVRITYKCNRQGRNRQSKGTTEEEQEQEDEEVAAERDTNILIKTDCQVVMVISERNSVWKITRVNLDHNHPLSPSTQTKFFRAHKDMTDEEKKMIRTLNDCNIPTRKMIAILAYLRGGLEALRYGSKDISNLRTSIRRETSQNDMMQ